MKRAGGRYSAVSYTWGTGLPSHQLLIFKPSTPGATDVSPAYLNITANVDSFLRHLRKAHKAVHLWIDAVCLNQMDNEEKAQQIPQMGDIYRAAKKVQTWLGDDDIDDARHVFSLIRQVGLQDKWSPSQHELSWLVRFFKRAWFTRRWIVQEAVLAHEAILRCGFDSLSLSWVLLALKKAQLDMAGLDALGYGPKMLLSSVVKYQEAPTETSLLTFLWDLHRSECSDPRDRVAALYGLASGAKRPPELRYNEGADQLYWDCAAYFLNRDAVSAHTLILHLAEFGSRCANSPSRDLPSWVPDWSRSRCQLSHGIDGLQDTFKLVHSSVPTEHNHGDDQEPRQFLPIMAYTMETNPQTQMSVDENVLRIYPQPAEFSELSGLVKEVYLCGSSDWQDVRLLLNRVAHDLAQDDLATDRNAKRIREQFRDLLAFAYKDMWGKEILLRDLDALIDSSQLSHRPSKEDIERLEGIGSILSRFSLIRRHSLWSGANDSVFSFGHTSFYHLGPREAAVGDFLVPFYISKPKTHIVEEYDLVMMCLRPTSGTDRGAITKEFDPGSPFRRSVRWVGLTFHKRPESLRGLGRGLFVQSPSSSYAFYSAWEDGLPGPYVFEVM